MLSNALVPDVTEKSLVRPCILECRPYVAGKPREEVQRLIGSHDVIKLASNENPLGPSPLAMEAVRAAIPEMHFYPDDASTDLRRKLGERWGLGPDQILVGNGSMHILELLCKTFLAEDEEVVTGWPSFRVFGGLVRAAGGRHVAVPLNDHVHDLDAMAAAVNQRTKMVIVCNPNNPTGTVADPDALREFARSLPPDVVFVLDEAYQQFTRDGSIPDFRDILALNPNTIVLHSFSKIYGLAGLRVGYTAASALLTDYLERARMPFVANRLAQAAAMAALEDHDFVRRSRENNFAGQERMAAGLDALGLRWLPTEANFMAVEVGDDRAYFDSMMRQGVIVFPGSATDMPGWVRVTVGLPHEVERYLEATRKVLAQADMGAGVRPT